MLAVSGLRHRFADRLVLDEIQLTLAAGEVLIIMGPNGAGKTTLLRILAGILPVQSGTLQFAGEAIVDDAARSRMRARIGLLTEATGLYEQLSVRENLRVFGRLQGLDAALCERRIDSCAAHFGVQDRLQQRAGALSKGLKQRVALIRALLHEPRVLLLDEPTSGLDPDAAAQLHDWIDQARSSGTSVLLATHDLAEARRLGGAVQVLDRRMAPLLAGQALSSHAQPPDPLLQAYRAALAEVRVRP